MKNNNKNAGITLIALIITVLIMLILAGVVISELIMDNGFFNLINNVVIENKKAQVKERIEMEIIELLFDKKGEELTFSEIADRLVERGITTVDSVNNEENTIITIDDGFVVKITKEDNNWKVEIISSTIAPKPENDYYFEVSSDVTEILKLPFTVAITVKNNDGTNFTKEDILYTLSISNSDNLIFDISEAETTGILQGGSKQEKILNVTINKKDTAPSELQETVKLIFSSESPRNVKREINLQVSLKSEYYYIVEVYDHFRRLRCN